MSTGGDETLAGDPTEMVDQTRVGGGPPGGGGPPDDSEGDSGDRRRLWFIALGVLAVGLIVGAVIAVAAGGGNNDNNQTAGTTSTSASTSTSTTTTPTTQPKTTTTHSNTSTTTTQAANLPKINSFTTNPASKTCATASDNFSVTLSWSTSNTTENVLSVDGGGAYGTYSGTSGSQVLTPGCPPAGMSTTHSYKLTAKGPGGPDATKTITFSINTVP